MRACNDYEPIKDISMGLISSSSSSASRLRFTEDLGRLTADTSMLEIPTS
eukprot:m.18400 g.18400  ORF g.18400 m.18400 type:complete len:50 (-) comp3669_c0_seq1:1170-1319(-)